MKHFLAPIAALAVLAACQPVAAPQTAAPPPTASTANVHAFAQAACGGCHAVDANALSPNPDAPEWPRIVNTPGLTDATLTGWLRDAHNYPEEMDFDLEVPQIEDLVSYMMTLKQDGYEPPIQ